MARNGVLLAGALATALTATGAEQGTTTVSTAPNASQVFESAMSDRRRAAASPWLNVKGVCARAGVGRKVVYAAIAAGRLRAAHIDGRRAIRVHVDWVDQWLTNAAPPIVEIRRDRGVA
jgi:excisionase family DNA binding protein